MSNTSLEKIGCFKTILDPIYGITIESKDLPSSKEEFENKSWFFDWKCKK